MATKPLDFSDLGATAVPQQTSAGTVARSSAASPIDFSDLGATPVGSGATAGTQEDAQPESALSRFGHNFLSGLGVTSNDDAKNFFEHPINTLMNSLNAQGELAKKAKDAYDRGDYKGAVVHGLNYLVPFIGQQTDKAGEQLSQGDYAGGIGRTLGAAVPIVAGSPEVQAGASDAASAAASTGARAVRAAARGTNTVLEKAPGSVGATAGTAIGHATGIPGAAEVGGAAGYALGKEVLPQVRVPGEGFGLPNRVTGGPAVAPAYEAPVRGSIAEDFHAAVNSPARTLPGQIAPEVINPPRPGYMQPSEPIQSRPGLSLPAAPQGAELADLPVTGARSAAQTGEALANLPRRGSIAGQVVDSVQQPSPQYAYRMRDVGEQGIPKSKNSSASLDQSQVEGYRDSRGSITGKPQEMVRVDLNKLPSSQYRVMSESNQPSWVEFHNDIPESAVERVDQPQPQTSASPVKRGSIYQMMNQFQDQVGQGLGAKPLNPNLPIGRQLDTPALSSQISSGLPEGHTPANSSAVRSYKYDPQAQEFHANMTTGNGTTHVFGDVSPEEAQTFDQAESKGKAFQAIKQNHPLVAKIINGKRIPITPSDPGFISSRWQPQP